MKTIEAAAENSYGRLSIRTEIEERDFKGGFAIGVEFAQRWIPISEEFPPEDVAIIFKFTKEVEKVYCKLGWVCCGIVLLDNGDSLFPKQLDFYGIEWRLIELK